MQIHEVSFCCLDEEPFDPWLSSRGPSEYSDQIVCDIHADLNTCWMHTTCSNVLDKYGKELKCPNI